MRAAVLKAPGNLELDDLTDPECPEGGALIEVKACSVCGTDVKMLQKGHKDLVYPRVLGHEIVGKIALIDQECGITEGDLVQVWPGIACGRCRPCLRGNDNQCERLKILGFNRDGGFAEIVALPRESISRGMNLIDRSCPNIDAVSLAEPLACCLNGQELAAVGEGDVVLIIGGGPIGCLHAALAQLRGAEKVIVAERLENRIDEIKNHTVCTVLNAALPLKETVLEETCERGVDVILMATPEVGIDKTLLSLLAPGGRMCIFSGPRPGEYEKTIDVRSMHYRELTMVGAYGCSSRQNKQAVRMLASGALDVDWIITKRTNLEGIAGAMDYSSERRGLKAVIDGI